MNLLFILLLSCINVNMSGKLKHEVDLKIKMVDDTGVTPPETGDANEESPSSRQGVWFEP
jgi:hypothetical protein